MLGAGTLSDLRAVVGCVVEGTDVLLNSCGAVWKLVELHLLRGGTIVTGGLGYR